MPLAVAQSPRNRSEFLARNTLEKAIAAVVPTPTTAPASPRGSEHANRAAPRFSVSLCLCASVAKTTKRTASLKRLSADPLPNELGRRDSSTQICLRAKINRTRIPPRQDSLCLYASVAKKPPSAPAASADCQPIRLPPQPQRIAHHEHAREGHRRRPRTWESARPAWPLESAPGCR